MTTDQDALDAANRRGPISLQTACALIGLMLFSVGVSILLSGPKQSGAFFVFYPVFLLTGLLLVLYDLRTSPISSPCDEKKNVKNADINETGKPSSQNSPTIPRGALVAVILATIIFLLSVGIYVFAYHEQYQFQKKRELAAKGMPVKMATVARKIHEPGRYSRNLLLLYVTETHSQEWFPVLIDDYQKTKEGDSIPVYVLPPRNEIIPVNFELDNHQPASSILFYYFAFLGAYYLGLRRYLLPC